MCATDAKQHKYAVKCGAEVLLSRLLRVLFLLLVSAFLFACAGILLLGSGGDAFLLLVADLRVLFLLLLLLIGALLVFLSFVARLGVALGLSFGVGITFDCLLSGISILLVRRLLVTLARLPAEMPADLATRRVANVVRELAETFYEPWSLDRACARAGMSRRHFSKLFRVQAGRTFLEHLTELRLVHAAKLLEESRHSIIGAAFSSGYSDLSHFYRLFRARFGHPPRTWLEKRRGAALPRQG